MQSNKVIKVQKAKHWRHQAKHHGQEDKEASVSEEIVEVAIDKVQEAKN